MGSRMGNVADVAVRYNSLKNDIMPFASPVVAKDAKREMRKLRDGLWQTLASMDPGKIVVFNSPLEVISVVSILLDTGKIFGISWRRKTTSKSNPAKIAGSIDTLTVKKVNGYVKGTSGGKKQFEDVLSDRLTLWVANGELQGNGYGNWRTIYAQDIKGVSLGGKHVKFDIS